jgi:cytoskeletal protein RodZ
MADLGSRLKEARLQRGVALRDIATTTKISIVTLEALERDDYSRMPGGIFSRSFVRAYAAEVGLDPDETLAEFLAAFTRYQIESERSKKRRLITPDDRAFAERQRRALQTLRVVLIVAAVGILVALVYAAWRWNQGGM